MRHAFMSFGAAQMRFVGFVFQKIYSVPPLLCVSVLIFSFGSLCVTSITNGFAVGYIRLLLPCLRLARKEHKAIGALLVKRNL
jgi:hypothetical protein